eukprot:scaffold7147_cov90-Attheya_sp.AAC.1
MRSSIQLLLIALVAGSALAKTTIKGPYNNGVEGSGFGCDNPCNDGDVNYVIRASLETYTIKGTKNRDAAGFPPGEDVKAFTRTFTGVNQPGSSPFCNNDDGTTGPLNPCLTVNPGQKLRIKVINDMENGMTILKQNMSKLEILQNYANLAGVLNTTGTGLNGTGLNGTGFESTSTQNMPGYDTTFDVVNIHLHGLQ